MFGCVEGAPANQVDARHFKRGHDRCICEHTLVPLSQALYTYESVTQRRKNMCVLSVSWWSCRCRKFDSSACKYKMGSVSRLRLFVRIIWMRHSDTFNSINSLEFILQLNSQTWYKLLLVYPSCRMRSHFPMGSFCFQQEFQMTNDTRLISTIPRRFEPSLFYHSPWCNSFLFPTDYSSLQLTSEFRNHHGYRALIYTMSCSLGESGHLSENFLFYLLDTNLLSIRINRFHCTCFGYVLESKKNPETKNNCCIKLNHKNCWSPKRSFLVGPERSAFTHCHRGSVLVLFETRGPAHVWHERGLERTGAGCGLDYTGGEPCVDSPSGPFTSGFPRWRWRWRPGDGIRTRRTLQWQGQNSPIR